MRQTVYLLCGLFAVSAGDWPNSYQRRTGTMTLFRMTHHYFQLREGGSKKLRCAGSIIDEVIISAHRCLEPKPAFQAWFVPAFVPPQSLAIKDSMAVFNDSYERSDGRSIEKNGIAATALYEQKAEFFLYASRYLKTEIATEEFFRSNHSHLASVVLVDPDSGHHTTHEVTVFLQSLCAEYFRDRGYDSSTMICAQGTRGLIRFCDEDLGTAIFFTDPDDWSSIYLLAVSVEQGDDAQGDCHINEPKVFALLYPQKSIIIKAHDKKER